MGSHVRFLVFISLFIAGFSAVLPAAHHPTPRVRDHHDSHVNHPLVLTEIDISTRRGGRGGGGRGSGKGRGKTGGGGGVSSDSVIYVGKLPLALFITIITAGIAIVVAVICCYCKSSGMW